MQSPELYSPPYIPLSHNYGSSIEDLAKLFQVDQGANQGIVLDTRENLVGDVERKDVAECIIRLIVDSDKLENKEITFSMINRPGPKPSEYQWGRLLSLFTVPKDQLETSRESS